MQSTVSYETLVPESAGQLAQGAFLVSGREEKNLMTIGWGQWGRVWGTPSVLYSCGKPGTRILWWSVTAYLPYPFRFPMP
jgi:hypothetical protein